MTTKVVADDQLARFARKTWELQRRLIEGTLGSDFVANNLQLTIEGKTLGIKQATSQQIISPLYADEEVESYAVYPDDFIVKHPYEQLCEFARHFSSLRAKDVWINMNNLPPLFSWDCNRYFDWYVIPYWRKLADSPNDALELILDKLAETRKFKNWCKGRLGSKHLRFSEKYLASLDYLYQHQQSDYLLIPAQTGILHRGRSVIRARAVFQPHEFGLGPFEVATILLAHPNRIQGKENELWIDCPAVEYSPNADNRFNDAFYFDWHVSEIRFHSFWTFSPQVRFGSASGLLPQY